MTLTVAEATCGARKPGFDQRPMIGANSQPCVRPAGHDDDHRNVMGRVWPRTAEVAVVSVVNDVLAAPLPTVDVPTLDTRGEELAALQAQASVLWARVLGGEDSAALRARIGRLEALQAALVSGDASLVASCHCGGRQRMVA